MSLVQLAKSKVANTYAVDYIDDDSIDFGEGVDAKFLRLNSEWGFKFYRYDYKCRYCWLAQGVAARHGIGPRVGHMFKFEWRGNDHWGYITELAKPLNFVMDYPTFKKAQKVRELMNKFKALFGHPEDIKRGNIGQIGNRYVWLDYGEIAWGRRENFTQSARSLLHTENENC